MNYIIHPATVYLMGLAIGVKVVSIFFAIFSFVYSFAYWRLDDYDPGDETERRHLRNWITMAIVSTILGVIIPTRSTMIAMLVAKIATRENVAMTVDALKSVVDYVIEAIKAV